MRWKPKGAVAVVTGASSGIGRCLCRLLVQSGAPVVAVARRADRLHDLESVRRHSLGWAMISLAGDITQPSVREEIVNTAHRVRGGSLDLLVNNAGIGAIGPFAEATPDRLRRVMEVNFFAPVELTRLLLPSLRRGSAPVICNISSVLGHRAVPNKSEYCASKFALHGWSDSLKSGVGRRQDSDHPHQPQHDSQRVF